MLRIVITETNGMTRALDEAVRTIRAGGVIAMPTDTLYGLAVDPRQADAVARVFAVKGRGAERALPLIAADAAQVIAQIGDLPPLAERLASRFWPGPLTLLLAAPAALAADVNGGTGRIGVRVPAHDVARAVCRACASLLTATSANLSGHPPSADPDVVAQALAGRIDLLVDAGRTPGGLPSTIVDATGEVPVLVRAGAIALADIDACCR